jgi:flagellar biosynthesis GTPase FlhF
MATRIKRYEVPARELDGLLARIESEMGPDAELETRHFQRGGLFGLIGGQQMVEVIAVLTVEDRGPVQRAAAQRILANGGQDDDGDDGPREPIAQKASTNVDAMAGPAVPSVQGEHLLDVTADAPVLAAEEVPTVVEDVAPVPESPAREVAEAPLAVERIKADAQRLAAKLPKQPRQEQPVQSNVALTTDAGSAIDDDGVNKSDIAALRNSITDLKVTIDQLVSERAAPDAPAHTKEKSTQKKVTVADPASLYRGTGMAATERGVYDRLLNWNIMPMDAIELLNFALATWDSEQASAEEDLLKLVFKHICRGILLSEGIHLRTQPPGKVVALVGATGVGKTTTIAKLAAQFAFQQGKRVSLVSLDNYRIAAAEQLRTYGEIMGLDLDIVFSREEFDQVLTSRRTSDLVLVDTAGRSPVNVKQIGELCDIFRAHPPDEVHLVVSASTKADDLRMQLENFEALSFEHVILSKLDETQSLGCLFNLSKYCRYPISYFTVGQSVPEDVRTANLTFVRTWIEQGRIS